MNALAKLVSEDQFLNSYHLIRDFIKGSRNLDDVNLRLIKPYIKNLTEIRVSNYYKKYIKTELAYSLPELFTSDAVSVPKKLTGVREYRYFSAMSAILYNAIGLLFIDLCQKTIDNIDFKSKNIYAFYPTKFYLGSKDEWVAKNDYRNEYKNFVSLLDKLIEPGDVILQTDISNYFESIPHIKLIGLIEEFATKTSLKKHDFNEESYESLAYYFNSLMLKDRGIPQGRKNLISDFYGYFFLLPFDLEISELTKSDKLELKASVRYVDDTFLIFRPKTNLPQASIFKELLKIEQKVSNWLHVELGLQLNIVKTERTIIKDEKTKEEFFETHTKNVYGVDKNYTNIHEIINRLDAFIDVIRKYSFPSNYNFRFNMSNKDREVLKAVFDPTFLNFSLNCYTNRKKIIKAINNIDFELTVGEINIICAFLLSDLGKKYLKPVIDNYLKNQLDLKDKRHIHILLNLITYDDTIDAKKIVLLNKDYLATDSYGKYLLSFYRSSDDYRSDIHRRIEQEYYLSNQIFSKSSFLYETATEYKQLLNYISHADYDTSPAIQCLKRLTHEKLNNGWSVAFNHLQNLFHELCKREFSIKNNNATVFDIVKSIPNLTAKEELVIVKFYHRRNFNAISHPSMNGLATEEISQSEFNEFEEKVMHLIVKRVIA